MIAYKPFSFYFDVCKRHRVKIENLLAKHHMNLLVKSFSDLYFKHASLDEFEQIAQEYKISHESILEIYVLGRFVELMLHDELKKSKQKVH
jgi:hypothetical protein